MKYPTELELLEFFGVEPAIDDDVTGYTVSDNSGLTLAVTFSVADDSLQTSLRMGGRLIASVCHEGMTRLWIADGALRAEFEQQCHCVNLKVSIEPQIQVAWSGLRTE